MEPDEGFFFLFNAILFVLSFTVMCVESNNFIKFLTNFCLLLANVKTRIPILLCVLYECLCKRETIHLVQYNFICKLSERVIVV